MQLQDPSGESMEVALAGDCLRMKTQRSLENRGDGRGRDTHLIDFSGVLFTDDLS